MVKVYVVGLPETGCEGWPPTANIALMVADTVCPEVPLYVQVRGPNVASAPEAKRPDNVRVLPPVQLTEAVPETVSEPLSVTGVAPKLCMVNVYTTVPLPSVGSLLVGVLVKSNPVIFGMLTTCRV